MATFSSTGHTVFREGDPGVPDIAAEKRGKVPSVTTRSGRDGASSAVKTRSGASRRPRKRSEMVRRALRVFSRRCDRSGRRKYRLDGPLVAGLWEEADRRRMTEREVLEEVVRAYLANRRV